MKIGVTGSNGFIGKNLLENLSRIDGVEVITFTRSCTTVDLENFVKSVDFIFHLAGINRPKDIQEFYQGNEALTQQLVSLLLSSGKKTSLLISSSTQIERDNDYAKDIG